MAFKRGDRVVLLSVPMKPNWDDTECEGVGEVSPINRVHVYDDEVWYDVAGWMVRDRNLRRADQ